MKELSWGCWRCCGKPRKFEHISKIGLRYISSAWSEGTKTKYTGQAGSRTSCCEEDNVAVELFSLLLRNRSGVRSSVCRPVITTDTSHGFWQSLQTNSTPLYLRLDTTVSFHILANSLPSTVPSSRLLATPLN